MRVLAINTSSSGLNGITTVIENYARLLKGIVVFDYFASCGFEQNINDRIKFEFSRVFVPKRKRHRNPISYFFFVKKVMRGGKYDAVHVHANSATAFIEVLAAKQSKIKNIIVHSHSTNGKHLFIHKLFKKRMSRYASIRLACSKKAGEWLFSKDFLVLQNGIDAKKYLFSSTVRKEYRKKMSLSKKIVLGHVGYMETEKNHSFLINAFLKLLTQRNDYILLLVGEGRLKNEFQKIVNENNAQESIIFLGSRSDLNNLYQAMDIFLLPSLWEGVPLSLVEAQTSGLKCIASDTITQEVNFSGLVSYVPIGEDNTDKWLEAICKTSVFSDGERDAVSKSCLNSEYDLNSLKTQLIDIYSLRK